MSLKSFTVHCFIHWKKSVYSPVPLNSALCSYLTLNLLSSSSLLCSERRLWSRRRSYRWNWQTSEMSWVRDSSCTVCLSSFTYDVHTYTQGLSRTGHIKPGILCVVIWRCSCSSLSTQTYLMSVICTVCIVAVLVFFGFVFLVLAQREMA